ncbi:MAG: GAF domain-containing protein [Promethearchaeota archaeon]
MSPKLGIEVRDKIIEAFTEFEDNQVYPEVLGIILTVIESKYGIFGYINESGDLVCPSMTKDVWEECQVPDKDIVFPHEDWNKSNAIWARAIIEGKTIYSNQPLNPPEGHIPMNRAIVVPIMHQKKVIGVLTVANKTSDYSEEDIAALKTIASYISPILYARLESNKQLKELKKLKKKQLRIDKVDKQILHQLYLDGRLGPSLMKVFRSNKSLMSHTGIQNRIKRLIDSDILKIQGNINFNSLDIKVAYLNVRLENYEDIEKFVNKLIICPRVFLISRITGQFHIKLGVIGKSMEDINYFINHCLLSERELINSSEIIFASDVSKPEFLPLKLFDIDNQNTPCGKNCLLCDPYIEEKCFGCDFL